MEGKVESSRADAQQSSRVHADTLLNFDCEVFPFIFEMGVDAFCTMLSKCLFLYFKHGASK